MMVIVLHHCCCDFLVCVNVSRLYGRCHWYKVDAVALTRKISKIWEMYMIAFIIRNILMPY